MNRQLIVGPQAQTDIEDAVRRGLMRRFPFGVYFVHEKNQVHVLAVLHLSRRPGLWKHRLRSGDKQP